MIVIIAIPSTATLTTSLGVIPARWATGQAATWLSIIAVLRSEAWKEREVYEVSGRHYLSLMAAQEALGAVPKLSPEPKVDQQSRLDGIKMLKEMGWTLGEARKMASQCPADIVTGSDVAIWCLRNK